MKGFYDNILPKEVSKYVKQWGAGVEQSGVRTYDPYTIEKDGAQWVIKGKDSGNYGMYRNKADAEKRIKELESLAKTDTTPIWRVKITPQMREGVKKGQPLFMPQSLKEDMTSQAQWMNEEAQRKGYESVNHLASESPEEFKGLASKWREMNRREDEAGNLRYMPKTPKELEDLALRADVMRKGDKEDQAIEAAMQDEGHYQMKTVPKGYVEEADGLQVGVTYMGQSRLGTLTGMVEVIPEGTKLPEGTSRAFYKVRFDEPVDIKGNELHEGGVNANEIKILKGGNFMPKTKERRAEDTKEAAKKRLQERESKLSGASL